MNLKPVLKTDEEEVLVANQEFYQALEKLDLERMEALWWHEDWAGCLPPGRELLTGWEDIHDSWAAIFQSTVAVRVIIRRPVVHVHGEAAWVCCLENVTITQQDEFTTAVVEATNIFLRRAGQWRLAHRHTTLLPDQEPVGASHTIQ